ncbi:MULTISPECIES: CPBP family intramembrane glutamic endopeptidase [Halococcus]|uniref:CAAX amino terminal protease family protein n=1 Tax=Halococcus salifodinae DSM 8989 TaxID=1227456 RepID=M0N500_9EURY|nr:MULTISPECIES: type II CAAX endopeptidase family protein [Halococcus]EMA52199.1 CAAX amino terminal protease family protein [Halococcus salifodinae DSM 8989]
MASDHRESAGVDGQSALLDLLSAVTVIALAVLLGSVAASLASTVLIETGIAGFDTTLNYIVRSIAQFVGFGIAVAAYLTLADAWSVLRARAIDLRGVGWIVAGVVTLLTLSTGVSAVLSQFGIVPATNQVIAMGRENPVVFLYMIPVTLLFVAPFEELVFRGAAQGLLRRAFGPAVAVGIASALFGAVHLIALIGGGTGQLAYVVVAALLGVVLGGIYERTQNLLVPIVVHGLYNATLFAIQWVDATGSAPALL